MTKSNFTTAITVGNSPTEIFNAINNPRAWWSEEIEGTTDQLHAEWNYHYQDVHRCKIKVVELVPDKKVVWQVMDNFFSFTKDKSEWTDNKIVFEITEKNKQSELQFTQIGLVPEYECYDICENAWRTYIQKSLYNLITTGQGQPNARDKPQTEDEKQLATTHFTTTFFVNQTPEEVFNAINHVGDWWQGEITGNSGQLNDEFDYRMLEIHFSKQKVVEIIPNQKVVWEVTDSHLSPFGDPKEWNGTKVIFEIMEINNKTQLRFTHEGLVPKFECYDACSGAWELLIQQSLYSLVTTGKGKNVF